MRSSKVAKRFFVSGRVQGVGYRYFALNAAKQLGIAGYARNLPDGRVEVYAVGTTEPLRTFAQQLLRGPQFADVADVQELDAELLSAFDSSFSVN
jgi:acylphosphatase